MISLELIENLDKVRLLNGIFNFQVSGVSLPEDIKDKTIVFAQSKKLLEKIKTHLKDEDSIALIIDEQVWNKHSLDFEDLLKDSNCVFLSSHFDQTMCEVSKIVYKNKISKYQGFENKVDASASIHSSVVIHGNVCIEEDVIIMGNVSLIGPCHIKKSSIIYPNVSIYPFVTIGENSRIHSHCTIGSDGFGYKFFSGKHQKVWQSGGVEIGRDVEIGANTCIDSGAFIATKVGEGTKIDNQVQIGHNVSIGNHCIICGSSGMAGSSKLGDYSVIAGGAGIGPGCELGAKSQVAGGAMVNKSWPEGSSIAGYPATKIINWKRSIVKFEALGRKQTREKSES